MTEAHAAHGPGASCRIVDGRGRTGPPPSRQTQASRGGRCSSGRSASRRNGARPDRCRRPAIQEDRRPFVAKALFPRPGLTTRPPTEPAVSSMDADGPTRRRRARRRQTAAVGAAPGDPRHGTTAHVTTDAHARQSEKVGVPSSRRAAVARPGRPSLRQVRRRTVPDDPKRRSPEPACPHTAGSPDPRRKAPRPAPRQPAWTRRSRNRRIRSR
jgi:hypothetical protein